jgi:hypothetical protein
LITFGKYLLILGVAIAGFLFGVGAASLIGEIAGWFLQK